MRRLRAYCFWPLPISDRCGSSESNFLQFNGKRVCKRVEPKALEGERARLDPQLVLLTFFVAKGFGSELNPRC